ncbi:MAG TPA: MFS transporter [Bradyrhizobium sp.]|nr:MFS transporter [Bradyrhizobium sp.]
MALNPLAMDMMLPALPNIRSAFQIADANRPQMVLSIFLVGFGVGQFVMGPLSDRFGRRPVLLGGMTVYTIAGLLAIIAPSFETLLLARALQGLGTAATRVIATSIVRDCYAGRRMASVMSLAMMVFIAVPVIAPSFGQAVMLLTHWRGIFVLLMIYGVIALAWSAMRMPETLPKELRKSLAIPEVLSAFRQTVTNRQTLGYALAAGGVQGYFGGWTDLIFQRLIEIWTAIPSLYLLLIISAVLPPGFFILLGILLLFSWVSLVGLVRAEFLRGRNFEYIQAARALGVSNGVIMFRHLLPNAMVATMTFLPFIVSSSVMTLTALDFLGFGLPPGSPSLGELLSQGKANVQAPWLGLTGFFSVAIMLSLLIFIGEAARDAFDPRKTFSKG